MKMDDLETYLNNQLKNSQFQEAWEESCLEFEVARQLVQLRQTMGITQQDLATKLGTKQSAISRLERGVENITLSRLQELVEALNGEVEIRIKRKGEKMT